MNKAIVLKKIAKSIIATPTIWNTDNYKVSVYPQSSEGSHKERHVSITVSKDKEKGNIAINNGKVLNGNLSQKTINWCNEVILTDDNKRRINQMLDDNDFYRLDKKDEIDLHPIVSSGKNVTAYAKWEDTGIKSVKFLTRYKFEIKFEDGSIKICDIEEEVKKYPKIFKKMIDHPEIARKVHIEPLGTGIYWDDLMGFPCDWLYQNGIEKI